MKTFTRIPWSDEAAEGLKRALPEVLEVVADEVRNGISILWLCESDLHRAYCVTRQDRNPDELCIVAFQGSGAEEFGPFFIQSAHAKGIPVRVHVIKRSLARLYRRVGMLESEIILRSFPNA